MIAYIDEYQLHGLEWHVRWRGGWTSGDLCAGIFVVSNKSPPPDQAMISLTGWRLNSSPLLLCLLVVGAESSMLNC